VKNTYPKTYLLEDLDGSPILFFLFTLTVVILCAFDINIVLLPYSEAQDNKTFL